MHPFFTEIEKHPDLKKECRMNITSLPEPFIGKNKIKAILLGADPTNDGISKDKGLKILETVFGINSEYEKFFFAPQLINLKAVGLDKDNLYIQNICRNYFVEQTAKNKNWNKIAKLWIKYLYEEIKDLPSDVPVLVTAEKIMKIFVCYVPHAEEMYLHPGKYLPFYSDELKRNIYPLYRNPKYFLTKKFPEYKKLLKEKTKCLM